MGSGKGGAEMIKRTFRTALFIVIMMISFLGSSIPVLISAVDVMVPCILVSTVVCCGSCFRTNHSWSSYNFQFTLVDIPLLSLIRSIALLGFYSLCSIVGLGFELYLAASGILGLASAIFLFMKCSLFANVGVLHMKHASMVSLHVKHMWGMFLLVFCSLILALGHIMVAYKVKCQAQRKMHLYRLDLEALNAFAYTRVNDRYKRQMVESGWDDSNALHDLSLKFLNNQGKS